MLQIWSWIDIHTNWINVDVLNKGLKMWNLLVALIDQDWNLGVEFPKTRVELGGRDDIRKLPRKWYWIACLECQ